MNIHFDDDTRNHVNDPNCAIAYEYCTPTCCAFDPSHFAVTVSWLVLYSATDMSVVTQSAFSSTIVSRTELMPFLERLSPG